MSISASILSTGLLALISSNMLSSSLILALCASSASAFPWMASLPGVDLSLLERSSQHHTTRKRQTDDKGSAANCPVNPDHPGAAPYDPLYPYTGATGGLPGTGIGGVSVPADGDEAHAFTEPGPLDIRGPCPGMNTAANHNVGVFACLLLTPLIRTHCHSITEPCMGYSCSTL